MKTIGMNSKRLFFLDFIRALSVLMIIQYHFNIQLLQQSPAAKLIPGLVVFHQAIGDLGVTLFIIISGVALMTNTSNEFSAVDFYKKRILAIFPSYWIAYIVIGCVLFLIRGYWVGDGQPWKFILTFAGFDGLTLYRGENYYLIGEWFIGFILCLYLLFPVLRYCVLRYPVLTWGVSFLLVLILHKYYSNIFVLNENRNPLIRLPEFIFGLLFLSCVARFGSAVFGVSAIALIIFAIWYPPIPMQLYGIFLGIAFFCVTAFISELVDFPKVAVRFIERVAKYSFLAFLAHHQIIYILLPRFDASNLAAGEVYVLFGLVVLISFVAGKLLYGPVTKLTNVMRQILFMKNDSPAIAKTARLLSGWAAVLGLIVLATSIYGIVNFYSPVPWWDEWDGYIGFYRNITSGWAGGWWVNHMEHRIIFSRLLNWLDIRIFGGIHVFLFVAEVALISAIALCVWRQYARGRVNRAPIGWVVGIILALLYSWVQEETLRWGFETQVIAAYTFSVLAAAHFSRLDGPRGAAILMSVLFAILAEFSMGNGLMAFPMLFALCIVCRRPAREFFVIGIVWVILWSVYFVGYTVPAVARPELPTGTLVLAFFKFFLAFLGNPLAALTNNSVMLCSIVGAFTFIVACSTILYLYIRNGITSYRAFLIGGYGFVVLSALAAMSGRAYFGAEAALVSRYTTGPLLGWLLVSLLVYDAARTHLARSITIFLSVALATAIAPFQKHAAGDNSYLYNHKLAILAHKIGADRPELDALLFPAAAHRHFSDLATYAEKNDVALYGKGWLKNAGEVKFDSTRRDDSICLGYVDSVEADKVGPVVKGWVVSKPLTSKEILIVLTDDVGSTIGYGVTGQIRPDVASALPEKPTHAGWTGFLMHSFSKPVAYAYVADKFCKLHSR